MVPRVEVISGFDGHGIRRVKELVGHWSYAISVLLSDLENPLANKPQRD